MDRSIPMVNRVCYDKDVKRIFKIHSDKLHSLKPIVNSKGPPTYKFLKQKLKRNALEENRRIQVNRQNKKLYQKIEYIANRKPSPDDHRQGLAKHAKKLDSLKIQEENFKMGRRIRQQRSVFSVKQWLRERKQIQQNINRISEFKYKNYKKSKSVCNFWAHQKNSFVVTDSKKAKEWNQLYQKVKRLQNQFYNCTVSENDLKLKVAVQNIQNPNQYFQLVLDYNQGFDLIRQKFKGSIELFVDAIGFDKKQKQCYVKYQQKIPLI